MNYNNNGYALLRLYKKGLQQAENREAQHSYITCVFESAVYNAERPWVHAMETYFIDNFSPWRFFNVFDSLPGYICAIESAMYC